MRKTLLIMMAVLLLLSLFACGKKDESGEKTLAAAGKIETETAIGTPDIYFEGQSEQKKNEPPTLGIEYNVGETVSFTMVKRGTYQWTVDLGNGQMQTTHADSVGTLSMGDDLASIKLQQGYDEVKLIFSAKPENVTVQRWDAKYLEPDDYTAAMNAAEAVELEGDMLKLEEGSFVYEVFSNGEKGYCSVAESYPAL